MKTIAHDTTERSLTVCGERRPLPIQPRRYSYDFADQRDAAGIAALGDHYSPAAVRASLATGDDEWIVARRGRVIVAAVHVRAADRRGAHAIDAPVVAEEHRACGLERYLTHLADVWLRAMAASAAA